MEMGPNGCKDHFRSLGYRLVPWLSWEEWNFVREGLFSSSSESISMALNRIIAWHSRGCLPVSVEITAAIKDIQQRDPFFRTGILAEFSLSQEALRMGYSMAITRLLNGVLDQSDKRKKQSINDSAEEIGLPRMLVDIRHESAHNRLPSLSLLRLASKKALDWLNSNYWEHQKNVFPNILPEIRLRLYMFALDMKRKQSAEGTVFEGKTLSFKKQIKGNLRRLVKFCAAYPAEVVSVLLDKCLLKEVEQADKFKPVLSNTLEKDDLESSQLSRENWKSVVDVLCHRKPEMRTMLIKAIIERITAIEADEFEQEKLDLLDNLQVSLELKTLSGIKHPHTRELAFWVTHLLNNLDLFRKSESGVSELTETHTSFWHGPVHKQFLQELLSECLQSLAYTCALSEPALIIAELIGNKSLTPKIEYLVSLQKFDQERQTFAENFLDQNSKCSILGKQSMGKKEFIETKCYNKSQVEKNIESFIVDTDISLTIAKETVSLEQAKQQFESLRRLHGKNIANTVSGNAFHKRKLDEDLSTQEGPWSIVKSWKPCAIGLLPSVSNSRGVLPVLDRVHNELASGNVLVEDGRHKLQQNVQCNQVYEATNGKSPGMASGKVLVEDGRHELQKHVQCNKVYEATKCKSPCMSLDGRMEENEPGNPYKHSEQAGLPDKVMRGDDKHVSDGREGDYRNGKESYSDVPDQQNVKRLKKGGQKEFGIQGQLLADGVYKACGPEELKVIQSAVCIFDSFRHCMQ